MLEHVILGTSHEVQDTFEFEKPLTDTVMKHSVILIAEEYPFKCASRVAGLTANMRIPYLQVDPFPEDWTTLGIEREMKTREQFLAGQDIRLSHADAVREDFWLKKIEANLNHGCVLVACGYLHINFLAEKVEERGGTVVEKSAFPAQLLDRKPDIVLDPSGLEDYLKKLRAGNVYPEKGSPLGHSGETETR